MHLLSCFAVIVALAPADGAGEKNPVFNDLLQHGVQMSNGTTVKLPPPILADGLDAAAQRAALERMADARCPVEKLLQNDYYAPVIVKVRTVQRPSAEEGPAGREVDLWFVVHGAWKTLDSRDFLDSMAKPDSEGQSRVVSRAGLLTADEMARRGLQAAGGESFKERFAYATFSLFEQVELSVTRRSAISRGRESIVVAGRIDRRFDADADYPNQWRALLRDQRAEIKPGRPHAYDQAGGYAKITRLAEPADGALIEFHLVYEEPYGWFDGANLVKQKLPAMAREKVRALRRRLATAGESKTAPARND